MKTIAPLHIGNLLKSFAIVLILLTVAWSTVSFLIAGDILFIKAVFLMNLLLAIGLGYLYYRWLYHSILAYDGQGFQLQHGRTLTTGKWADFYQVSLLHLGYGNLAVRLYKTEGDDTLDIPAADLKMDASALRFELMGLVKGTPPPPQPKKTKA
jgi:hypothetical protein